MDDSVNGKDLKALLESYERALILSALATSGGHQRRAAAALGLLPSTLCEKMKRLGISSRQGETPAHAAPRASAPGADEPAGAEEPWTR